MTPSGSKGPLPGATRRRQTRRSEDRDRSDPEQATSRILLHDDGRADEALTAIPKAKCIRRVRTRHQDQSATTAPSTVPRVLTAKTRPTDRPGDRQRRGRGCGTARNVVPRHTAGTNSDRKTGAAWNSS